jgi:hypothetical protein
LERELKNLKKEAEIMKNVDGWEVVKSQFYSMKFMPRSVDSFDTTLK